MKKIIALLLIFAMCLSFVACNSDKKKDDDDDETTGTKSSNTVCSECMSKYVSEWFFLNESYNGDNYEYELKKISITEDGKLITDKGEFTIKFNKCSKSSHGNYHDVVDGDGNKVAYLEQYFYSDGINIDKTQIYISWTDGEWGHYRSLNQYTVVEITEDNWQQYFSTNINDNFDVTYTLNIYKDQWGEIEDGSVDKQLEIKNLEKYAYGSTLTIEYSYDYELVELSFDIDNEVVFVTPLTKEETTSTTTDTLRYDYDLSGEENIPQMNLNIDSRWFEKEDLLQGTREITLDNPKEILRMKGWLVIRNDV